MKLGFVEQKTKWNTRNGRSLNTEFGFIVRVQSRCVVNGLRDERVYVLEKIELRHTKRARVCAFRHSWLFANAFTSSVDIERERERDREREHARREFRREQKRETVSVGKKREQMLGSSALLYVIVAIVSNRRHYPDSAPEMCLFLGPLTIDTRWSDNKPILGRTETTCLSSIAFPSWRTSDRRTLLVEKVTN